MIQKYKNKYKKIEKQKKNENQKLNTKKFKNKK